MKTLTILCAFVLVLIPSISIAEDYHVLQSRDDGRTVGVVFHIPVPVENNAAGVALRTAVSEYAKPRNEDGTGGDIQSRVQGIETAELTQLQSGELYEHSETLHFLALDTNGQKQAKIDNRYAELTTIVVDKLRTRLKFWGLNRDVP